MARRRRPRARAAEFDPAKPAGSQYTGQRPFADPWMDELMSTSRAFWQTRNVQLPDRIALDVADDLRGVDGVENPYARGWQDQSRVAFDARWLQKRLDRARDRELRTIARRKALKQIGTMLLHETGHVGGVEHNQDGFMNSHAAGLEIVPQEMTRAVRKLIPRTRPTRRPRRTASSGSGVG
jgi:hypothetical protein